MNISCEYVCFFSYFCNPMEEMGSYKVDLKGMPSDEALYQWHVDDRFFSAVHGPEIKQGNLAVAVRVKRTQGVYELKFSLSGTVKVECDRCLELMDIPIEAEGTLRAKFGAEYGDDGDWVVVPENDGTLDVSWHIYEIAALDIPVRRVHPEGLCNETMAAKLRSMMPSGGKECADGRWDELKKITLDN